MKTSKKKQSAADLMAHKLALLMCLPNSSFDKCKRCQLFPDCEKERLKEKNFKPKVSDCEKKIKQYYKEKADIPDGWDVLRKTLRSTQDWICREKRPETLKVLNHQLVLLETLFVMYGVDEFEK